MLYVLNLIGYLLVVTINAAANIIPINGQQTGEVSNKLNVLFTPAGYVFSIWGLIYILLGIWVLRQWLPSRISAPVYEAVGLRFFISCLLNTAWIFCWHYNQFGVSVVVMILLLLSLIDIYLRIKSVSYRRIDLLPFSIYLGWISVATIANISYWLTYIEWNQWGLTAESWTIIMMTISCILAIIFLRRQQDVAYVLVFIWALIGIGVANLSQTGVVSLIAFAYALILSIIVSVFLFRTAQQKQ